LQKNNKLTAVLFQKISNVLRSLAQKTQRNTGKKKLLPEIDGLRFMAIMPVLFQHLSERVIRSFPGEFSTPIEENHIAFLLSRGSIGVFIFFAISGFILSLPFAKYYLFDKPKKTYKSYLWKRVTRIEPPFLIWMTIFTLILFLQGKYGVSELIQRYFSSITYTHNIIYGEYSVINPVAWSLEVEVQFYLIAPLLITLFYQVKEKWARRATLVITIIGFVSLQHYFGWIRFPYKPSLLGQFQHFLVGILIADVYLLEWRESRSKSWIWDLLALLSFVVLMYTWTAEYLKSLIFMLALVIFFIGGFKGKLFSSFLSKPLIYTIGGMCYTIYLIHLPLMQLQMKITGKIVFSNIFWVDFLCQAMIALPIILLISAGLFIVTEKPFMDENWIKKLRRSKETK
jgi:peptidoglycan/LPS O-acetylase OafA/YrhL